MTDASKVKIYQRIGPGEWKFRAELDHSGKGLKAWADENGDEQPQPNEWRDFSSIDLGSWITGWYMTMNQAMTWFSGKYVIPVTSWTKWRSLSSSSTRTACRSCWKTHSAVYR